MKSFVSLCIVALLFCQCARYQLDNNPPFQISEATYQDWVGGRPGMHGFNINLKFTSKAEVAFDSIYVKNKVAKTAVYSENGHRIIKATFSTSTRNDELMVDPAKPTKQPLKKVPFPFELAESEAVISYRYKGKVAYYKISRIKKLSPLYHQ